MSIKKSKFRCLDTQYSILNTILHFSNYYSPDILRGEKPNENPNQKRTVLPRWQWVNGSYDFDINSDRSKIAKIEIDPSNRMADVNRENNNWKSVK